MEKIKYLYYKKWKLEKKNVLISIKIRDKKVENELRKFKSE